MSEPSALRNPRVLLATFGSLGDLHPFIALAQRLRAAGLDARLASALEYRERAEAAGVPFVAIRPSFADLEGRSGGDRRLLVRRAVQSPTFLFRDIVFPHLDDAYADLELAMEGCDVVLTSTLAFAARIAAEARCIPWLAVALQPAMLPTARDFPTIAGAERASRWLRRLAPLATGAVLRLGRPALARLFAPVHALRRSAGLPAGPRDPLFEGQFAGAGVLALYSPVLARAPAPPGVTVAGFALYDGAARLGVAPADDESHAELEDFFARGTAPLVFTLGSTVVEDPGRFFEDGVTAARALGRRALLLTGERTAPALLNLAAADVHVAGYAPHSRVFPRAAAVVHQGGIGTLAQALRAGRPQLIVPFFADQADNADRAADLGVAAHLPARRFGARHAARALAALLGDQRVGAQTAALAARLAGEDGAAVALDLVRRALQSARQ